MGFISWLNRLLNPDHNWTDYDENGNMTGRGLIENTNKLFNPNHNWMDYDKMHGFIDNFANAAERGISQLADPEQLTSWFNSQTGAHMVNADIERNEMQMQNQEDIYQRQVSGMQKAGLNPALMYQSGASSAPSAPAPTSPGLNMSDIMEALLLDKQSALLDSQIRNTDAKTDREVEETNRLKLINQYYPQVTETEINKALSAIGLTEQQIAESKSRIDLQELEKDLKELDKIIRKAEADESSEFYKARREYEQAKDEESKARAAELGVRAAMERIEKEYMDTYSVKMGSNDYIAIAACLAGLFDIDIEKTIDVAKEGTQNFLSRLRSKADPSYNNHNSHGRKK